MYTYDSAVQWWVRLLNSSVDPIPLNLGKAIKSGIRLSGSEQSPSTTYSFDSNRDDH